jgi:hypothetical protein
VPKEAVLRAAQVRPALLHRARPSLHTDLRQTAHLRPSQVRICTLVTSLVDRHLFDAEPNPTFHFDADPDQNLGPDPILIFTYGMLENHNFLKLKLIHSSASHYVPGILKYSGKFFILAVHLVEVNTDPDRQAQDADPDPEK